MINIQAICYTVPGILKEVHDAVSRVSHEISDTSRLEEDILKDVGTYLSKDESNKSKWRYIKRIIYSKISVAKRRNRIERTSFLYDEGHYGEDGSHVEYEPVDDLAVVDSDKLEIKETIELLAQNDRRKSIILNAWINGYTDLTEISRILADSIGGKPESHRRYITRFRIACRTELSALPA